MRPLTPATIRRARGFHRVHGRYPALLNPRTFNDKIIWRVLYDRRPLLDPTCDKLAMKEHARRQAPGLVQIPETLWQGTEITELQAVDLPERWVLKPNHASQLVFLGEGRPDVTRLAEQTKDWLGLRYWRRSDEWAYRRAEPLLLVEEYVGSPSETPADLKVLVFDGVPRVVAVHTDRATGHRNRLYTPEWQPLPWTGGYPPGPDADPPERLEDMLKAASVIAAGYDMLRVDFYEHDGVLWFGEVTPYPGGGSTRVEPELDVLQGYWWTLPRTGPRRLISPRHWLTRPPRAGAGPGSSR